MYEVISTYPGCLEIPIKDHKLDSWFLIEIISIILDENFTVAVYAQSM